jgi:uncharacterized surface protein with fasciclin (FAS1) repeats
MAAKKQIVSIFLIIGTSKTYLSEKTNLNFMNLKRFLSFLKHALMVFVVLVTFGITGCDDDDDGPTIYDGTVLQLLSDTQFKESATVSADVALDSLVKYLTIYPDLTTLLSGGSDVTLFAPSNTAFISLLATPGFPANILDINPDVIENVLRYHIVSGKMLQADLTPTGSGAGIESEFSSTNPCTGTQTVEVIKVNENGTLLTGSSNAAIEITDADNQATNGVVHVTKTVLIPPSVGASLTPILGKLSATVLLASDFSYLAAAMTKADCGVAGVTPLSAILTSTGPFTAFLPPNAVFEGTAAAMSITVDQLIANFTAAQWRNIILNHIVAGTYNKAALTNGTQLTTMLSADAKLIVTDNANAPEGKVLTTTGGTTGMGGTVGAALVVVDLAASNGVAHVVAKILFPN